MDTTLKPDFFYYLRYIPDKGWDVRKEGLRHAIRHFEHKEEAVEYAQKLAAKNKAGLAIPKGQERLIGFGTRYIIYADPHRWDEDMND
jgi:Uncharacterized protein conserved in bacteria (DUF2188)